MVSLDNGTNVLILCTHNSARSILAEGMPNHLATELGKDVRACSAGSAPSGRANPLALETLAKAGVDTAGCRSKSWDEFAVGDAPRMRVVITVCDSAAIGDRMLRLLKLPFDSMDDATLQRALADIART